MALTITFAQAKKAKLDFAQYAVASKTPVPIATILDLYGIKPALQALGCNPDNKLLLVKLACAFAESTLYLFEQKYPDDKRPRAAIDAAYAWAKAPSKKTADAAARAADAAAASYAAARAAAAAAAAADAAYAAAARAADAARIKQADKLLELLAGAPVAIK